MTGRKVIGVAIALLLIAASVVSGSLSSPAAATTAPAFASTAVSRAVAHYPTLTAPVVSGPGTITKSYRWQRASTATSTFVNITGADKVAYTLTAADENSFVRLFASASNSFGTTFLTSDVVGFHRFTVNTSFAIPAGVSSVDLVVTAGRGGLPYAQTTYTGYSFPGRLEGSIDVTAGQSLRVFLGSNGGDATRVRTGGLGGNVDLTGTGLSGYSGGSGGNEATYSTDTNSCASGNTSYYASGGGAAASLIQMVAADGTVLGSGVAGGGGGVTTRGSFKYYSNINNRNECSNNFYQSVISSTPVASGTQGESDGDRSSLGGGGGGALGGKKAQEWTRPYGTTVYVYDGFPGTNALTGLPRLTTAHREWGARGYIHDGAAATLVYSMTPLLPQSVTWDPTTSILTTDSPLIPSVAAVSSAGGTVSYAKVSHTTITCSVDSATGQLTITGAGTCRVRAAAAPTSTHAAGSVDVTFTSVLAAQDVIWAPVVSRSTVESGDSPTAATATGEAPITYAVLAGFTTSTCSVNGTSGALTHTGTGSCTVRATAATTPLYASGSVDVTFAITKAAQYISWSPRSTWTLADSPVQLPSASSLGSVPIEYHVVSSTAVSCAVQQTLGEVTYAGTGQCTIRASSAESDLYLSGSRDVTLTFARQTPTLTWVPNTSLNATSAAEVFAAASPGASTGAVTYAVTDSGATGCGLSAPTSRTLLFEAAGSCEVMATVAATEEYESASQVRTFAIGRDSQSVVWSPATFVETEQSPLGLSEAATSGDGQITYSVTSDSGAGCAFVDPTRPELTFTASGSCSLTVSASATSRYAVSTASSSITISRSDPRLTWAPNTQMLVTDSPQEPSVPPTSRSGGSLTYEIVDSGATSCTVGASNGVLSFSRLGTCLVRTSLARTARHEAAAVTMAFSIVRASQAIRLLSADDTLEPRESSLLVITGIDGTGAQSLRVLAGSPCTLTGFRISAVSDGECIVEAVVDQDDRYEAARATLNIPVRSPAQAFSGGGSNLPAVAPSISVDVGVSQVEPDEWIRVPGAESPTRDRALPPAPADVKVVPAVGRSRSTVLIKQPVGAAGSQALATVVVVRDAKGKVISRLNVALKGGQGEVQVTVPFIAKGYSVNVYNVNEVGVSIGALTASPLVRATTIAARSEERRPKLFGTLLGSPIIFTGASSALSAQAKKQLKSIARTANTSNKRIFITGFARKGGGTANELGSLSTQRALSAAKYLAARGVRVWIRYWGAGSLNGTGRTDDRRVEVRTSELPIPRSLVP